MRQKIVAGNWKMNCDLEETKTLLKALKSKLDSVDPAVNLIIAPSFTNLLPAVETLKDTSIEVAAQNMHPKPNGPYTGEVSAKMLSSIGVKTVILGHSERRKYFGETKALLNDKVNTALTQNFKVIFCVGESLAARQDKQHFQVVQSQLKGSLFYLSKKNWEHLILAYEPVWAIGTGETATAQQAQEMHAFIREEIAQNYDQQTADQVTILYGGSVKPGNAQELFSQKDVDGGLIGGAALNADDFLNIANCF